MRNLFISSILVMTFCAAAFAQTDEISPCPKISLESNDSFKAGIGEYVSYAIVFEEADKYDVKFEWTVKDGDIVRGQGTSNIKIIMNLDSLTVEVSVKGLPQNCKDFFSLSFVIDRIYPIKIDEFSIPIFRIDKARLDNLRIELNNNPSGIGYIIEHFVKKTSRQAITKKNKAIVNYLQRIGIERERFVLLNALTGENLTQFSIVPAGAAPPTCDDCIVIE